MRQARRTARAVILHDDQLLVMERWRPGHHYFSIPGGGIEAGEVAEQTVVREISEETGCQVEVIRQLYELDLPDGTQHCVFLCKYISGEPHLPADAPEVLQSDKDNVFKPGWLPVDKLANAPFLVWRPIRDRLLLDLADGFAEKVVKLRPV